VEESGIIGSFWWKKDSPSVQSQKWLRATNQPTNREEEVG
jgi:hypothetical protein